MGQPPKAVATAFGVDVKTVRKWVDRFRAEGPARLAGPLLAAPPAASSRRHRRQSNTIIALRRQRWIGQADRQGDRGLASHGEPHPAAARLSRMQGPWSRLEPSVRYEHKTPGELIHIDIKKLGRFERLGHRITGDRTGRSQPSRGSGWEFVHVCIDDASRFAFSQILPDEKKESAVAFLKAAVAYYANLGVTVARVMTDNGSCYQSLAFRQACARSA